MSKTQNPSGQLALVTGASAGIGQALAANLARHGYDLVLVARRGERLLELKSELEARWGIHATLFVADLRRHNERDDLLDFLKQLTLTPSVLVNNAGMCQFEKHDALCTDRSLLALNVEAVHHLCRHLIPLMKQNGGYILNIASISGLLPLPGFSSYSASKHWMVGFGRSLSAELRGTKLSLTTSCPGVVKTDFFHQANLPEPPHGASAESIANASLKAMFAKKSIVLLPFGSHLQAKIFSWFPVGAQDYLLGKVWRKIQVWSKGTKKGASEETP